MKSKMWEMVSGAKVIAIGGHVRPDGDCVGSCVALYQYIRKMYPDKQVYIYFDEVSKTFDYLTVKAECVYDYHDVNADLFITLDASDIGRLGSAGCYVKKAEQVINIDHHISNTLFGDVNIVCPDSSSTCEVLYELFDERMIDKDIAEALYTGIVHDTGVFQYSNALKRTMEIGGTLKEMGIDSDRIIDETFYEKTYKQNLLLGRCLLSSKLYLDGKCIVSIATKEAFDEFDAAPSDTEGIVNQLRITKGVKVAAFIYELSEGEYKVSLRANQNVDVSKVCTVFGGGGHIKASGCTLYGDIEVQLDKLLEQIDIQITDAGL